MTDTVFIILFIIALIVTVALAVYAGKLFLLLRVQKKQQLEQQQKHIAYLDESILTISRAMHEEQCELSEGSLRLWVLLENRSPADITQNMTEYPGIYQMYSVVKDMPTHKARQQQDKKLTRQQDKIRLQAEIDLRTLISKDVERLIHLFSKQS